VLELDGGRPGETGGQYERSERHESSLVHIRPPMIDWDQLYRHSEKAVNMCFDLSPSIQRNDPSSVKCFKYAFS
jgi:hypothetical protein